jgi:transcriptional regulator with XRE-family HTH domain
VHGIEQIAIFSAQRWVSLRDLVVLLPHRLAETIDVVESPRHAGIQVAPQAEVGSHRALDSIDLAMRIEVGLLALLQRNHMGHHLRSERPDSILLVLYAPGCHSPPQPQVRVIRNDLIQGPGVPWLAWLAHAPKHNGKKFPAQSDFHSAVRHLQSGACNEKCKHTIFAGVAAKLASVHQGALRGPVRLKAWRKATGVSRRDLATILGLRDQSSITKYENGVLPLPLERLIRIHELSGIPIWDLAHPPQRIIIRALAGADPSSRVEPAPTPRPRGRPRQQPEQPQPPQEASAQ